MAHSRVSSQAMSESISCWVSPRSGMKEPGFTVGRSAKQLVSPGGTFFPVGERGTGEDPPGGSG